MGKLQDYPYIPASSLTGEDKLLIIRNKSQGLIKLSDLPANIPSDLKTQMNNIFNKKFKTGKSYSPDTWSATVNLMEKLVVKTLTGSIISFLDGADDVPLKSCVVYIPTSSTAVSSVDVVLTGKNIVDFSGNINSSAGGFTFSEVASGGISFSGTATGTWAYITQKIPVKIPSGTTITYSRNSVFSFRNYLQLTFDDETTRSLIIPDNDVSVSYTLTKNVTHIRAIMSQLTRGESYSGTVYFQLEIGSTATAYEPYNGTTNTASLGRAIYGGQVDVVNGTGKDNNNNSFTFTKVTINSRFGINILTCNNRNMKVLYHSTGTIPPEQPTLITKTVTSNGTYDADDDNADGYSSVTVNVSSGPEPTIISKTITENGVYNSQDDNADGYSTVEVNIEIPEPVEPDLDSKTVTSNGTYLASDDELDGYSSVTVNVPESSFTTKTITSNGTYQASSDDVDGYSSVTVNVSSSTLTTKTITSNGSYSASSDNVDGYSNVVVNVANANLEGKTITENGTYYATDDELDGYSAVIVNVPIPVPTLIEKTITENGTYDAEDDEADGYSSVTVNVQGAGSMSKVVYVEYVGADANQIPVVSSMIQGDDFASYISYDSTTKKFTVLQQFTALVIPWVKQYRDASTYAEGEFYVNDVKQTWFRVQTGSTGSINGNRLWINFQEGDTFWNKTPNSNGWPQQHLKIYKCVGLPITTDTFDFYNET